MASPSSSQLPPLDGLSAGFGFVLIRRQIADWSAAVGPGEPHQPSVAHARDSQGRTVSVAIKQADLPDLPSFVLKVDPGTLPAPALLRPPTGPLLVATVGGHALLLLNGDLFVYQNESPPGLLLLPAHPHPSARDWHSHRRTTGMVFSGNTFAVASLRPPQFDSTGWGDLHWLSSSTGRWDVQQIEALPANMKVQSIDMTLELGNGVICWADFSAGMVLANVFEKETPAKYIRFPASATSIASSLDKYRHRRNTISSVDGRITLIATKKVPSFAYEFLLWDFDMDTAVWQQKAVIDIHWAHSFSPLFPTLNTQDPSLLYFLEKGLHGRWYLHGIYTRNNLNKRRQRVLFTCNNDEISATAPWDSMQLNTANQGNPPPKRQAH